MQGKPFTTKSDVFALGRTVDAMTLGHTYRGAEWQALIDLMTHDDEGSRISIPNILQHPLDWIGLDWIGLDWIGLDRRHPCGESGLRL